MVFNWSVYYTVKGMALVGCGIIFFDTYPFIPDFLVTAWGKTKGFLMLRVLLSSDRTSAGSSVLLPIIVQQLT